MVKFPNLEKSKNVSGVLMAGSLQNKFGENYFYKKSTKYLVFQFRLPYFASLFLTFKGVITYVKHCRESKKDHH